VQGHLQHRCCSGGVIVGLGVAAHRERVASPEVRVGRQVGAGPRVVLAGSQRAGARRIRGYGQRMRFCLIDHNDDTERPHAGQVAERLELIGTYDGWAGGSGRKVRRPPLPTAVAPRDQHIGRLPAGNPLAVKPCANATRQPPDSPNAQAAVPGVESATSSRSRSTSPWPTLRPAYQMPNRTPGTA
jgi:hypothetical protein